MTISEHAYLSYFMAASTKFMDKLTAEQKEMIQKASNDAAEFCLQEMKKANEGYLKTIKDFGVEIYTLSAEEKQQFKTASEPVYKEFRDVIGGDLLDRARGK
ncbi:C4-dicarboxylate-binding periplasmic protein DctP [anaerobic digester metagenome]